MSDRSMCAASGGGPLAAKELADFAQQVGRAASAGPDPGAALAAPESVPHPVPRATAAARGCPFRGGSARPVDSLPGQQQLLVQPGDGLATGGPVPGAGQRAAELAGVDHAALLADEWASIYSPGGSPVLGSPVTARPGHAVSTPRCPFSAALAGGPGLGAPGWHGPGALWPGAGAPPPAADAYQELVAAPEDVARLDAPAEADDAPAESLLDPDTQRLLLRGSAGAADLLSGPGRLQAEAARAHAAIREDPTLGGGRFARFMLDLSAGAATIRPDGSVSGTAEPQAADRLILPGADDQAGPEAEEDLSGVQAAVQAAARAFGLRQPADRQTAPSTTAPGMAGDDTTVVPAPPGPGPEVVEAARRAGLRASEAPAPGPVLTCPMTGRRVAVPADGPASEAVRRALGGPLAAAPAEALPAASAAAQQCPYLSAKLQGAEHPADGQVAAHHPAGSWVTAFRQAIEPLRPEPRPGQALDEWTEWEEETLPATGWRQHRWLGWGYEAYRRADFTAYRPRFTARSRALEPLYQARADLGPGDLADVLALARELSLGGRAESAVALLEAALAPGGEVSTPGLDSDVAAVAASRADLWQELGRLHVQQMRDGSALGALWAAAGILYPAEVAGASAAGWGPTEAPVAGVPAAPAAQVPGIWLELAGCYQAEKCRPELFKCVMQWLNLVSPGPEPFAPAMNTEHFFVDLVRAVAGVGQQCVQALAALGPDRADHGPERARLLDRLAASQSALSMVLSVSPSPEDVRFACESATIMVNALLEAQRLSVTGAGGAGPAPGSLSFRLYLGYLRLGGLLGRAGDHGPALAALRRAQEALRGWAHAAGAEGAPSRRTPRLDYNMGISSLALGALEDACDHFASSLANQLEATDHAAEEMYASEAEAAAAAEHALRGLAIADADAAAPDSPIHGLRRAARHAPPGALLPAGHPSTALSPSGQDGDADTWEALRVTLVELGETARAKAAANRDLAGCLAWDLPRGRLAAGPPGL
ncbi:hypothetical protein H696_05792 [Fonticula alba]|uniref:Uncharacterized protein n=1 Tax=Fonticula alba TaxID=691883 RepID=A0A058Z2D4_FONAL|nr:hypothetical protein H696_05792 [Fonticula alba]KCV67682.1 hypothetical protein H696_05792 [Fonticula alba]|eukprot:XP_009497866.1 hypothetical protein H696_05792 [Fonticula alba]